MTERRRELLPAAASSLLGLGQVARAGGDLSAASRSLAPTVDDTRPGRQPERLALKIQTRANQIGDPIIARARPWLGLESQFASGPFAVTPPRLNATWSASIRLDWVRYMGGFHLSHVGLDFTIVVIDEWVNIKPLTEASSCDGQIAPGG